MGIWSIPSSGANGRGLSSWLVALFCRCHSSFLLGGMLLSNMPGDVVWVLNFWQVVYCRLLPLVRVWCLHHKLKCRFGGRSILQSWVEEGQVFGTLRFSGFQRLTFEVCPSARRLSSW